MRLSTWTVSLLLCAGALAVPAWIEFECPDTIAGRQAMGGGVRKDHCLLAVCLCGQGVTCGTVY